MKQKTEHPEYLQIIEGIKIQINEHKLIIKDIRRALRHSSAKDERRMYRAVIAWNKKNLRDAKMKLRLIKAQTNSTWWLWLIALLLCIMIMIVVPGVPLVLVFAPLWIMILSGLIFILFILKK